VAAVDAARDGVPALDASCSGGDDVLYLADFRRTGSSESILFALAFCNVPFHIFPISKREGDRTMWAKEHDFPIPTKNGLAESP
jgi:hypothetical protein